MHRLRQDVEDVGGLVDPAALLPGLGPDLVQRLPEAQRAVAGGEELGIGGGEAVLVARAQQELAPALGALPPAVLDREQFLAAARVGADQHEQAPTLVIEARGEMDPVGPEIDVAPGRGVAPLPARVLLPPALGRVPDRRRREPGGIGPEQRRQGLRELPRGHALQVCGHALQV
jgi:hypothetical protein